LGNNCGGGCSYCSKLEKDKCEKCMNGYFLLKSQCYEYCPQGFFADILRGKCLLLSDVSEIVFTKAYSTGYCSNMCGKMLEDCSCNPSCKSNGTCCTDYDRAECDLIGENGSKINDKECSKNYGCEICDINFLNKNEGIFICKQCKDDYFLYESKCYLKCPNNTIPEYPNFICRKKR